MKRLIPLVVIAALCLTAWAAPRQPPLRAAMSGVSTTTITWTGPVRR